MMVERILPIAKSSPARTRLTEHLRTEITANPGPSIGFGLLSAWISLVFQQSTFTVMSAAEGLFSLPWWMLPLFAYAATFFAIGTLFRVKGLTLRGRGYVWLVGAVATVGALICAGVSFASTGSASVDIAIFVVGSVGAGAGTAYLHLEWGRLFGHVGTQSTLVHICVGAFGAIFLVLLLQALPATPMRVGVAIIPILSAAQLTGIYRRISSSDLFSHGLTAPRNIPWRFLVTAFTHGVSFGTVRGVVLVNGPLDSLPTASTIAYGIAAILLFLTALFFQMNFNTLIYQVGFPLIAVGYLVTAWLAPHLNAGMATVSFGFRYVDLLMWVLCAYLIKVDGFSANWVLAWSTCSLLTGQTLGALSGYFLVRIGADSNVGALCAAMILLLLTVSLMLTNNRNLQLGWGMIRPGELDGSWTDMDLACVLIGREHNLTAREEEILRLLARGRNRAFIAEEFFISTGTVKTHVRSIYRKLAVHSQQELLDLIEKRRESVQFAEGPSPAPTTAF